MIISATLRVLLNGALKTGTPRPSAASSDTWFVPMQKQPTASKESPASSTASRTCVLLRIPRTWTPSSRARSSFSGTERGSASTSKPSASSMSRAPP